jgi:hypothetical protein
MSISGDPAYDIARQVGHALADEAAQPLADVQRAAPPDVDYFSELEASISEWSFGYGVAWALARMRDPLLASSATGKLAEQAVRDAWRSFSGESWTVLLGEDRARRGPVEGEPQPAPPAPVAAPVPPPAGTADTETASQYGDFMGKVARARPRRSPPAAE